MGGQCELWELRRRGFVLHFFGAKGDEGHLPQLRRQLLRAVPEQADWYESITSSPDPVFVAIREGKPLRLSRRNAQKKEGERKGDEDDE